MAERLRRLTVDQNSERIKVVRFHPGPNKHKRGGCYAEGTLSSAVAGKSLSSQEYSLMILTVA